MSYLMSNRSVEQLSKGAGAALISYAQDQVRELGFRRLCADFWSGNERRLIR